jgi:Type I phosphodiesterase / nucleotide pyrophosphatase
MGVKTICTLLVLGVSGLSAAAVQAGENGREQRVIIIGVDGVTTAQPPRLRELMSRAAWTLKARGVMPTLSSPNWASVINGAAPEQHGITSNGLLRRLVEFAPSCRADDGTFPTIFGLLRAERASSRIAVFHDWRGFANLLEKSAPDVLQHVPGAARTTEEAIRYWQQNRPELMFIHLDNVDHTGHSYGWYSDEYYKAVMEADGYVGQVLDMLDSLGARLYLRPGYFRSWRDCPWPRWKLSARAANPLDSCGARSNPRRNHRSCKHIRHGANRRLDLPSRSAAMLDRPSRLTGVSPVGNCGSCR